MFYIGFIAYPFHVKISGGNLIKRTEGNILRIAIKIINCKIRKSAVKADFRIFFLFMAADIDYHYYWQKYAKSG